MGDQRLDAHNEFLHAERLLQIVVGAQLEAFHHVVDGRAGGEKQYRRHGIAPADAAHHLEAVHAGHHHVGHQHVGLFVEEALQPLLSVFGQADAEALSFQRVFDNHGQGLFVLDQQYVYKFFVIHSQFFIHHSSFFILMVNSLPLPGSLCTSTVPPCRSTIVLT